MDPFNSTIPLTARPVTATAPATPPKTQTSKASSSFFGNIIKKIWGTISSIASSIFSTLTCCFSPRGYFNKREITLLRDERSTRSPFTIPTTPLIDRTIIANPHTNLTSDEPFNHQEPKYTAFDDSLENLRSFTREFSVLGVDAIYETMIVDQLDTAQTLAPSLPPVIKSIAKLLVEMGDKASKPLFKRFSEQKAQTIDPALQKIFKTLIKPDLNLLREKLTTFLNENLAKHTFKDGATSAADYIHPILNWISTAEEQRPPLNEWVLKNKNLNPTLVKQLLDKAQPFWNDQIDAGKRKLYLSLEETLCEEFKNTKVPPKQAMDNDYVRPILAWLLLSNHSIPLNGIFGVMDAQKEELIDKVFERLISLLVEKKIDQYTSYLEKTMQRHLGNIIQQMMQKNAVRISDFFSERLSELVTTMPFTETVDSLIHKTFHTQILGIDESEARREEEKQVLEKAESIAKIVPTNAEGLDAQIRAQNHLNTVANRGGNEAYLEQMLLEEYSKHPACNPVIKQMIEQEIELIKQGKEPGSVRRASEKALYTSISEDLLELMMPVRKRLGSNGEIEELDPFTELWDRIYLPDEFYELVKQYEDLTQEFATPETTALLEKIKLPAIEIIKKTFVVITKDKLKKQLISIVQAACDKITDPKKVDKINAEDALPNINKNLLETFSKHEISRNLSQFAPLFYKLVTADSSEHDDLFLNLQQTLINVAKSKFEQFNTDKFYSKENDQGELVLSGLSDQEWLQITQNLVGDLEKNILQSKINQLDFDPKKTSLGEITDILKKTFSSDFKGNNANFGNLSMDLIFKLGQFNSEWLINYFLKNKLSTSITEAVEPWRKDHKKLVDTLTESLRETLLNPETVKDLLADEAPKPDPLLERKLAHQIDVTARIAYDLILGVSKEGGKIAGYGVKSVLGGNADSLNKTITRIYKKLFNTRMINQSLIINASEGIFKSLSVAAEQVRMAENIKAHQLAAAEK